jgi:hypothetical protein
MCDLASYMKMTRGTNSMQQLWFIFINYLYMFRASICPSSGVQVVCSAHGVQHCKRELDVSGWFSSVLFVVLYSCSCSSLLQCWTPYAVTYNLYFWRWTYRCPQHVEIIYDNKSQLLYQVGTSRHLQFFFFFLELLGTVRAILRMWSWLFPQKIIPWLFSVFGNKWFLRC